MKHLISAVTAGLLLSMAQTAGAQSFPDKPITVIIPFAPGGGVDVVARVVGDGLQSVLGQPMVMEHREGAGGAVGFTALKNSNPDGYTLGASGAGPIITNPLIYSNLPYDPTVDFVPVARMASIPVVLVVSPDLGITSVGELLEMARANPGKVSYGSSGIGGLGHLSSELLANMAGVKFLHAPYKGTAPAVVATLSGEVSFAIASPLNVLEHIKAGTLIPLGVGGPERLSSLPDVPPISDTVPGYDYSTWIGLTAPAGTPEDRIDIISNAVVQVLERPEVIAQFKTAGVSAAPLTAKEFAAQIEIEREQWYKLIEEAGIKAE